MDGVEELQVPSQEIHTIDQTIGMASFRYVELNLPLCMPFMLILRTNVDLFIASSRISGFASECSLAQRTSEVGLDIGKLQTRCTIDGGAQQKLGPSAGKFTSWK